MDHRVDEPCQPVAAVRRLLDLGAHREPLRGRRFGGLAGQRGPCVPAILHEAGFEAVIDLEVGVDGRLARRRHGEVVVDFDDAQIVAQVAVGAAEDRGHVLARLQGPVGLDNVADQADV